MHKQLIIKRNTCIYVCGGEIVGKVKGACLGCSAGTQGVQPSWEGWREPEKSYLRGGVEWCLPKTKEAAVGRIS